MTDFEVEAAFAKFIQVYIAHEQAFSCLNELPEDEADALKLLILANKKHWKNSAQHTGGKK